MARARVLGEGGRVARRRRAAARALHADDLYAVVKTEPGARAEASPPAELEIRDWTSLVEEDPVNVVGQYADWSRSLYRLHLVARGRMPRHAEFMPDVRALGRGLVPGFEEAQRDFDGRLRGLPLGRATREDFRALFAGDDTGFVARLYENVGLAADPAERERARALLLLHYFGFLRRNPDDPPDNNLEGFSFWLAQLEQTRDPERIALAFRDSFEYERIKTGQGAEP